MTGPLTRNAMDSARLMVQFSARNHVSNMILRDTGRVARYTPVNVLIP